MNKVFALNGAFSCVLSVEEDEDEHFSTSRVLLPNILFKIDAMWRYNEYAGMLRELPLIEFLPDEMPNARPDRLAAPVH